VLTGGEVAETHLDGLDDDELRRVSLGGGGRWILLEPAPGPLGDSLDEAVARLASRGFASVVAHPERHLGADLFERLARVVERGALVQVTADTLVDPRSAGGMLELAARGLVHVLGSDSHSSRFGRPAVLSAAFARLGEVEPTGPHLDWIAEHAPRAIVRGEPVRPPYPPAAP
jgi:tyrosine-protein phosphatase YwqE